MSCLPEIGDSSFFIKLSVRLNCCWLFVYIVNVVVDEDLGNVFRVYDAVVGQAEFGVYAADVACVVKFVLIVDDVAGAVFVFEFDVFDAVRVLSLFFGGLGGHVDVHGDGGIGTYPGIIPGQGLHGDGFALGKVHVIFCHFYLISLFRVCLVHLLKLAEGNGIGVNVQSGLV